MFEFHISLDFGFRLTSIIFSSEKHAFVSSFLLFLKYALQLLFFCFLSSILLLFYFLLWFYSIVKLFYSITILLLFYLFTILLFHTLSYSLCLLCFVSPRPFKCIALPLSRPSLETMHLQTTSTDRSSIWSVRHVWLPVEPKLWLCE